jgi:hypothetical protein
LEISALGWHDDDDEPEMQQRQSRLKKKKKTEIWEKWLFAASLFPCVAFSIHVRLGTHEREEKGSTWQEDEAVLQ